MKRNIKTMLSLSAFALTLSMSSCVGDLDVKPIDPNLNTKVDVEALFNKCFANLGISGNGSSDDDCDVDGIDGGTSGFVRQLFNSNELPTDEAICCWGDPGIAGFTNNAYDGANPMLEGFYYRLYFGVSMCNQYLAEAGNYNAQMTAEVRWLRALYYYYLMDNFGNIPFSTAVTSVKPPRYTRAQVYEFIEKELLEIEPQLSDARAKKSSDEGYARPDKAADWLLLSRLYLNAEVYTGTAQWAKAKEYAKKVMDSPYHLNTTGRNGWSAYQMLFMGDNGESSAAKEAVLPVLQDGVLTTSWACSLFLMASTYDNSMHPYAANVDGAATNGTTLAWAGNRARPNLVAQFFNGNASACPLSTTKDIIAAAKDDRALFWGDGRTVDVTSNTTKDFKKGLSVTKFTNFYSSSTTGAGASNVQFPDADFFLMRVAEAYLTYGEADARLNGGKTSTEGTNAINALRKRANAKTQSFYNLNDIISEWSREFFFEGRRRMDLIRFGLYGGNSSYVWSWKGGTQAGRNFAATRNLFDIPTKDLNANPNLKHNEGYN